MKFSRRRLVLLATGVLAPSAFSRRAAALDYPARPVKVFEGFGGGGTPDLVSRLIGQWLSEKLGQPFVVENRTGAAGNIATEAVVTAPPDGYTLLTCLSANAINASLYEHLEFNFLRDTVPVAGLIRLPMVLLVNPSFPATTFAEFIAYAKANPGKINMASPGVGTPMHVAGELIKTDGRHQYHSRALSRPGAARSRICWPGKSRRSSSPSPRQSALSGPASCAHWR